MTAAIFFIGSAILFASINIKYAIDGLSSAIREVARQIHVHAETMNEIKHQGIGIDKELTIGEKVARGLVS